MTSWRVSRLNRKWDGGSSCAAGAAGAHRGAACPAGCRAGRRAAGRGPGAARRSRPRPATWAASPTAGRPIRASGRRSRGPGGPRAIRAAASATSNRWPGSTATWSASPMLLSCCAPCCGGSTPSARRPNVSSAGSSTASAARSGPTSTNPAAVSPPTSTTARSPSCSRPCPRRCWRRRRGAGPRCGRSPPAAGTPSCCPVRRWARCCPDSCRPRTPPHPRRPPALGHRVRQR